jgi:hypothetical protein
MSRDRQNVQGLQRSISPSENLKLSEIVQFQQIQNPNRGHATNSGSKYISRTSGKKSQVPPLIQLRQNDSGYKLTKRNSEVKM